MLGMIDRADLDERVKNLVISNTFGWTHLSISKLQGYEEYFTDHDVIKILKACIENRQINWIAHDDDVKQFILNLYELVYENKRYIIEQLGEEAKQFLKDLKSPQQPPTTTT